MDDKKTVLVTGAGGSLAKRVIARLHGKYNVIAVDFRRQLQGGDAQAWFRGYFSRPQD
jgi:nucleoside-diphosphate-sugar epimerase